MYTALGMMGRRLVGTFTSHSGDWDALGAIGGGVLLEQLRVARCACVSGRGGRAPVVHSGDVDRVRLQLLISRFSSAAC